MRRAHAPLRAFCLRRPPDSVMVPLAPVTRSGKGDRFVPLCHPADSLPWQAAAGRRTGGCQDRNRPAGPHPAFADRGKACSRDPIRGGRTRRRRVIARRAPLPARRGLFPGHARGQSGSPIHTGRRSSPNATAPTPETDHRASPSRNGRPTQRHWRSGWHAPRCILSPTRRAPSRKPCKPPFAAPPVRGRATRQGGRPEFRTE